MPEAPDEDKRYALILEEVRYSVTQQFEELRAAQNRSSQLLQFGGLVATFLGGLAIRGNAHISPWLAGAAIAFSILTLSVVVALYPRKFQFATPEASIWNFSTVKNWDPSFSKAALAKYLSLSYKENTPKLLLMRRAYLVGIFALVGELVCLLFAARLA